MNYIPKACWEKTRWPCVTCGFVGGQEMLLMAIRVSELVTSNLAWWAERAQAQPQRLVIQITTAYKNAPWPHIDRLTFRMFNSYLRNCERAATNGLPDSRSHCLTVFPSPSPWCEPGGTAPLECPWWNSTEWPFDLTQHLVSAQGTYSIINNWTMVTAD